MEHRNRLPRSARRRRLGTAIVVLLAVVCVRAAAAQVPAAAAEQQPPQDATALARLIEEQRRLLEAQGRLIDDLTKRLDETTRQVAESRQCLSELEARTSAASPQVQQRLTEIERSLRTLPELTRDELSEAADVPGSLRIPGTDSAVRLGGQVRTLLVRNLGALGTDDRFVTSSIPVEGTAEASKDSHTTLSASPSRFETDFRTQTPVGQLRAFLSGDFAGSGRTYRLRHAFGQWSRIRHRPDVVDVLGPEALAGRRVNKDRSDGRAGPLARTA